MWAHWTGNLEYLKQVASAGWRIRVKDYRPWSFLHGLVVISLSHKKSLYSISFWMAHCFMPCKDIFFLSNELGFERGYMVLNYVIKSFR